MRSWQTDCQSDRYNHAKLTLCLTACSFLLTRLLVLAALL